MKLGEAAARDTRPGATLIVPLSAFSSDWASRPDAPICVGLRLLSELDRRNARKVAEDAAVEIAPGGGESFVEEYNDAVRRQVVAVAMCDPNDATKPHEMFPYAEDQVAAAFTRRGIQLIFDAVEQHEIDTSPLVRPADRAVLERLARLIPHLDPATLSGRMSRRLTVMLEEVEAMLPDELVDAGGVDDASDESAIIIGRLRQGVRAGILGPG